MLRNSGAFEKLTLGDPPIGLKSLREKSDQQAGFQEDIGDMSPGDKLFVFTDGIFDYQDRAGNFFGSNRLYEELRRLPGQPVSADIKSIEGALAKFGDQAPLHGQFNRAPPWSCL